MFKLLGRQLQADNPLPFLARFLTVGAAGTLIDVGLFALLHSALGWPALAANPVSYSAGILNNYVWHRRWTYAGRARKAIGAQAAQFLLVSLSALALNSTLLLALTAAFAPSMGPGVASLAAKAAAAGVGLGWNFLANHFCTFRTAARAAVEGGQS